VKWSGKAQDYALNSVRRRTSTGDGPRATDAARRRRL